MVLDRSLKPWWRLPTTYIWQIIFHSFWDS